MKPQQLDLFRDSQDANRDGAIKAWRCTIHMIQWRRLNPASYLYHYPIGEWYGDVIRGNLASVGELMGVW